MKHLPVILMVMAVIVCADSAFAQRVKGAGIIDFDYVVLESKAGKEAQDLSRQYEQAVVQQILAPKRDALIKLQNENSALQNDKKATEEAKKAKTEELQAAAEEYNNYTRAAQQEVQKKNAELSQKIVAEVKEIAGQVAKEKKISFLADKNSIVFTDDIPDITEDVLVRYNKQFDEK